MHQCNSSCRAKYVPLPNLVMLVWLHKLSSLGKIELPHHNQIFVGDTCDLSKGDASAPFMLLLSDLRSVCCD